MANAKTGYGLASLLVRICPQCGASWLLSDRHSYRVVKCQYCNGQTSHIFSESMDTHWDRLKWAEDGHRWFWQRYAPRDTMPNPWGF